MSLEHRRLSAPKLAQTGKLYRYQIPTARSEYFKKSVVSCSPFSFFIKVLLMVVNGHIKPLTRHHLLNCWREFSRWVCEPHDSPITYNQNPKCRKTPQTEGRRIKKKREFLNKSPQGFSNDCPSSI